MTKSTWKNRLHNFELAVGHVEEFVGVLLLATMAAVVNLQIVARYVFNSPFIWPEEIARLTLVWLTFIGAAAVARRGIEISVDTFVESLPGPTRFVLKVVRDLLLVAVFTMAAYQGWALAEAVAGMPLAASDLPTSLLAWPVTIGSALMALHPLVRIGRAATDLARGLR